MSLPTAYLMSTKRLPDILDAIKTAKAPDKFSQRFLESLEFKSKSDRLIINLLKSLNFLDDTGKPKERYFEFLDQSQSAIILAAAIKGAYKDLFNVNINAYTLTRPEIIGKFKTLTQGQYSDKVISLMATTFEGLVKLADFKTPKAKIKTDQKTSDEQKEKDKTQKDIEEENTKKVVKREVKLGGLVYNIQLILPETRDTKVYDALFKSLKDHIL